MDCYLCGLGASVPHGRMLCAWRVLGNAAKVRLAFELEGIMKTTEPNEVERLRLAWWLVRHSHVLEREARTVAGLARVMADRHPMASADAAAESRATADWLAMAALRSVDGGKLCT